MTELIGALTGLVHIIEFGVVLLILALMIRFGL